VPCGTPTWRVLSFALSCCAKDLLSWLQWFFQRSLTEKYFSMTNTKPSHNATPTTTGKILSAASFIAGKGLKFLVVGCETGVYVASRGDNSAIKAPAFPIIINNCYHADFQKVLPLPNATHVAVLQSFNRFVVQTDSSIYSYSLDLLARVSIGRAPRATLDASMEKIAEGNAIFFRTGQIGKRTLRQNAM